MTSIRDVAKLAGVSPSTVSRVMNGTAKVDEEKMQSLLKQKEEILKAYRESKENKEIIRPKDYDEIRKEKIDKFNKGK